MRPEPRATDWRARRAIAGLALLAAIVAFARPGRVAAQPSDGTTASSPRSTQSGGLNPTLPPAIPVPAPTVPPPTVDTTPTTVRSEPPPGPDFLANQPQPLVEPIPIPPPRIIKQRRYNMIILGVGTTVATWASDRLLAQSLSNSPVSWIPLVGPWYMIDEQRRRSSLDYANITLLAIDGLLQLTGVAVTIAGVVWTKNKLVVALPPTTTR